MVLRMGRAGGVALRAAGLPFVVGVPLVVDVLHATATMAATTIAGRSTVPICLRRIVISSCDRDAHHWRRPTSRSRYKVTFHLGQATQRRNR